MDKIIKQHKDNHQNQLVRVKKIQKKIDHLLSIKKIFQKMPQLNHQHVLNNLFVIKKINNQ